MNLPENTNQRVVVSCGCSSQTVPEVVTCPEAFQPPAPAGALGHLCPSGLLLSTRDEGNKLGTEPCSRKIHWELKPLLHDTWQPQVSGLLPASLRTAGNFRPPYVTDPTDHATRGLQVNTVATLYITPCDGH